MITPGAGERVHDITGRKGTGTVLVSYMSRWSGMPLLAVRWDGEYTATLALPECVEIIDPGPWSAADWLSEAKGGLLPIP
jgi:hypothetical protein